MNKKDLMLWLLLIGLTIFSYLFSESSLSKSTLVFLLLGITGVKFLGVGFQFMELKKAHTFWKVSYIIIYIIFSVLVLLLSSL